MFEWNPASCRVLEKAGYSSKGRLRRAVVKDGHVLDQFMYAAVREDTDGRDHRPNRCHPERSEGDTPAHVPFTPFRETPTRPFRGDADPAVPCATRRS